MKRYLAVIEVDVVADNDLEAAREAARLITKLETPTVYVVPVDDNLEHWTGVDFVETDEDGNPYVCVVRPTCFDFPGL